jgi:hypothetical protein
MLFASTTKGFLCLAVVAGLANTAHAQQTYCDTTFPGGGTTAVFGVSCVCSIHFDKFCTLFYWGVVPFIFKFILTSLTQ